MKTLPCRSFTRRRGFRTRRVAYRGPRPSRRPSPAGRKIFPLRNRPLSGERLPPAGWQASILASPARQSPCLGNRPDQWQPDAGPMNADPPFQKKPGDPAPSWRELGKANLARGRPVKVVVVDDSAKGDESSRPARPPSRSRKTRKKLRRASDRNHRCRCRLSGLDDGLPIAPGSSRRWT